MRIEARQRLAIGGVDELAADKQLVTDRCTKARLLLDPAQVGCVVAHGVLTGGWGTMDGAERRGMRRAAVDERGPGPPRRPDRPAQRLLGRMRPVQGLGIPMLGDLAILDPEHVERGRRIGPGLVGRIDRTRIEERQHDQVALGDDVDQRALDRGLDIQFRTLRQRGEDAIAARREIRIVLDVAREPCTARSSSTWCACSMVRQKS